jgi:flagellar hook protein FlgE
VSGALEASNVDLAAEFTNLITTQRAYSAASRIITTADQMLEELLMIKR